MTLAVSVLAFVLAALVGIMTLRKRNAPPVKELLAAESTDSACSDRCRCRR